METSGLAVDVVAAAAPLASHAKYRTVSAANLLISGANDLWGKSVRIRGKSASCWQSGGKLLHIRYKLVQNRFESLQKNRCKIHEIRTQVSSFVRTRCKICDFRSKLTQISCKTFQIRYKLVQIRGNSVQVKGNLS